MSAESMAPHGERLRQEASVWLRDVKASARIDSGHLGFLSGLAIGLSGNLIVSILFAISSNAESRAYWLFLGAAVVLGIASWILLRMAYWSSRLAVDPHVARDQIVSKVVLEDRIEGLTDEALDLMHAEAQSAVTAEIARRYTRLRPLAVLSGCLAVLLCVPGVVVRLTASSKIDSPRLPLAATTTQALRAPGDDSGQTRQSIGQSSVRADSTACDDSAGGTRRVDSHVVTP